MKLNFAMVGFCLSCSCLVNFQIMKNTNKAQLFNKTCKRTFFYNIALFIDKPGDINNNLYADKRIINCDG